MDEADFVALDRATGLFSELVGELRPIDLGRSTACGQWSVWDVVNHVCGGARRYSHYLRGGFADEIAWTRSADNLGADPQAAHDTLSAGLRDLFSQPGAASIRAHHQMQTVSGHTLLQMRVLELAVHAWDIASALNPNAAIDAEVADYLMDRAAPILAAQREHGYFAEVEQPNPGAVAQVRLLALTGRSMPRQ